MRLKANKTWSQHQLAIKLRVEQKERPGILSWERQRLLIHASKTALAAALCWWLALHFGLHDGYWGAISAIIVLQSNFGSTVNASRDRILGTVIGAAAWLFVFTVRRASVELHSGCADGGYRLRIAWPSQQFPVGRRHHHHHHACRKDWTALEPGVGARGRSTPGNSGGSGCDNAGAARPCPAAAA